MLELAQNRWITAHQSTLITGPSGAGKGYLAEAFGLNAYRNGFTVQYERLPTLLAQFVQARAQGTCDRLLRHLAKTALLVIDDFGLAALSEVEKQDLLEAIEECYGIGATLVASQLPIGDWHEYLGGGRLADVILDRLVHNAHRIELASTSQSHRGLDQFWSIDPKLVRVVPLQSSVAGMGEPGAVGSWRLSREPGRRRVNRATLPHGDRSSAGGPVSESRCGI